MITQAGRFQAGGRRCRTLGYFVNRKFSAAEVLIELAKYGFKPGSYTRVIVTWGWTNEAKDQAD
jgi:hypothetical protein